jgi:hypothetical protein
MDSMTDNSVAVVSSPANATQLQLVVERRKIRHQGSNTDSKGWGRR